MNRMYLLHYLNHHNSLHVVFLTQKHLILMHCRSGMTISTCLTRGMNREEAARFSFLLSIPAILGAMVLTIKDIVTGEVVLADAMGIAPMACGFVAAAVSGYLAIRFMVDVIKKGKLKWFSVYVFILGAVLILDQFVLHMIVK